jgi:Raf kinase inhibitor-like YbhB/YbcL family protein
MMRPRTGQFLFPYPAILLVAINLACSKSDRSIPPDNRSTSMMIKITSPSFAEGQSIPSKYTCDGENLSPPLNWDHVPEATKSLALICDDPDAPAGTWVHWVLYDLPGTTREMSEAVAPKEELPNGAKQGRNDFKQIGYGGPCPPKGQSHRYYFKLYALDNKLGLNSGMTDREVRNAMKGHILGEGSLMGSYKRK